MWWGRCALPLKTCGFFGSAAQIPASGGARADRAEELRHADAAAPPVRGRRRRRAAAARAGTRSTSRGPPASPRASGRPGTRCWDSRRRPRASTRSCSSARRSRRGRRARRAASMPCARRAQRERARGQVVGIGEVAARRLGDLEELLAEVLHLLRGSAPVERDEVGERPHRRVPRASRRYSATCTLNSTSSTRNSASKYANGSPVSVSTSVGAEARHRGEALLGDRDEVRLAAEVGREVAPVDADPRPAKAPRWSNVRVVAGQRLSGTGPNGDLHRSEQDRDVGDGSRDRAGRVLAVRDRDDPVLREQAERRLEADDEVVAGRGRRSSRRSRFRRRRRTGSPPARPPSPELEPQGSKLSR